MGCDVDSYCGSTSCLNLDSLDLEDAMTLSESLIGADFKISRINCFTRCCETVPVREDV
jgi:hypothetical protein